MARVTRTPLTAYGDSVRVYVGYNDASVVRYSADVGWGPEPVYTIDLVGMVNTTSRRYRVVLNSGTLSKYDGALTPAKTAEYTLRKQQQFDSDVNLAFSLVVA